MRLKFIKMVELKKYQQKAIDKLKDYLKELERVGSKYAFMGITDQPYKSEFFNETPFVCIKIPTGGGKTLAFLSRIVNSKNNGIIVLPTNELVEDQAQSICSLLFKMEKNGISTNACRLL